MTEAAHVVVAVEDTDLARALCLRIAGSGIAVEGVAAARDVLARAASADLIVLDLARPLGYALLERVRLVAPTVPIVALGTIRNVLGAPRARRRGASTYVNKASDPALVAAAVRAYLARD